MAKGLSIFVDESGDRGGKARYYLLTLVFHDQADSIAEAVTGYEAKLARADLLSIPFRSPSRLAAPRQRLPSVPCQWIRECPCPLLWLVHILQLIGRSIHPRYSSPALPVPLRAALRMVHGPGVQLVLVLALLVYLEGK